MFQKLTDYLKGTKLELKQVNWPTKKQTRNHTLLVIGISLALAAFLGAVDFGLNKLLELFIY